jgi:hypothetical protein
MMGMPAPQYNFNTQQTGGYPSSMGYEMTPEMMMQYQMMGWNGASMDPNMMGMMGGF